MDTTEVTQKVFEALAGKNPSKFIAPDKPVERVSWLAAVQFCNMRSAKEGLKPCYDLKTLECDFTADGYRLPTEAEWEYACRAGTSTSYFFGSEPGDLGKYAWFKGNSEKTTHPVKQKLPNPWGLCDMYGNVAEWCNDYYAESYDANADKDPHGPSAGETRVMRGGRFTAEEDVCRSSVRQNEAPVFADTCFGSETFGFRCVRKADSAAASPLPPGEGKGEGGAEIKTDGKPSP
jgi:formylglycine-generating enzyme